MARLDWEMQFWNSQGPLDQKCIQWMETSDTVLHNPWKIIKKTYTEHCSVGPTKLIETTNRQYNGTDEDLRFLNLDF